MKKGTKFTKRELETAIRVLKESRGVINWVEGEAKSFGVDLNTPEGQEYYERETRAQAERLIK